MHVITMIDTNPVDAPDIIPRTIFAETDTTDVTTYGFSDVLTVNEVMTSARNNAPGFVAINILEVLPHKVSYTQTWETQADAVAFTEWLREPAQDNLRNAYSEFLIRYRDAYQVTQTNSGENIDLSKFL
jgi:heme-degrading monooxygenase HmoA